MSQPAAERARTLNQICTEYGVDVLYVFGSMAGEVQAWLEGERVELMPGEADVDVGVKVPWGTKLSVRSRVRLAQVLEDLLAVPRVDLVYLPDADPFLAAEIIRGERLYARDAYEADEYELYVLRRAGDLAPFERERIALILEGP